MDTLKMNDSISITYVNIDDLKPAEYNPRKASDKQNVDLKVSIERFGLKDPIIVNSNESRKNVIIGGHFRTRVAKQLGYKEVPVVYVDIADIEKEKELNLRLNRNLGDFDLNLLSEFSEDMLKDVGFDSSELDKIFADDGDEKDDEVPEAPEIPKSVRGDIYQLGRHRVMCGDSTMVDDVEKLMDGKKADLVFTDPPYGFNYKKKSSGEQIKNDGDEFEDIIKRAIENIEGNCPKYVCGDFRTCEKLKRACISLGEPTNLIVWKKPVQQRLHKWEYCHEFIWYFGKNGSGFVDGNVWECKREIDKMHPTIKPVELISKALLSHEAENIVDLFGGSGSTLIACEKTNRICYGMEIDPKYCDVIVKRWEDFTGQKAVRI
jgi:DNA modification methylase